MTESCIPLLIASALALLGCGGTPAAEHPPHQSIAHPPPDPSPAAESQCRANSDGRMQMGVVVPTLAASGQEARPDAHREGDSASSVRKTITSHLPELQSCIPDHNAELQGHLRVRFAIHATGIVTMATIADSDFDDREVHCCMLALFSSWVFEPLHDRQTLVVTYPLELATSTN